jgi:small subunit ribosomal protein S16
VAVKIKLKRLGKIRAPYYRIVVADSRTKRDGRAIEEIGKYHPKAEPSFIEVNSERAQHWLSVGAQPTDPVRKLFEITGDWQKFKGLPGTEGTLKTAAPREDKKEIFAAAVKETLSDATDTQKGKGSGRSAGAGRKAAKPAAGSQDAAEAAATDSAQAKADKPPRAKSPAGKGRGSRAGQAEDGSAAETGEAAKPESPADPQAAAGSE